MYATAHGDRARLCGERGGGWGPEAGHDRGSHHLIHQAGAWTIKNTLYQHSLGARLCIFEVTLDGEQLKGESVSVGQAVPIDPSVTGGTRLVLTIDPYVLA